MGIIGAIVLGFIAAMIIDWGDISRNVVTHGRKKKKEENKKEEKKSE